jgi:hypothetical protein
MATNLRLTDDLDAGVKRLAERSGLSQQQVIRAAIRSYLEGLDENQSLANHVSQDQLPPRDASGRLRPPRTDFRRTDRWVNLPKGARDQPARSSLELLDRRERF